MNMHGIVRGAIQSVNKDILATLRSSTGATKNADFSRVPTYTDSTAKIQVQACTGQDLRHINNLNLQGVFRTVYLFGNWNGVVRADSKGGDILQFPQAPGAAIENWMAIQVTESWDDWTRLIVWLQSPAP